MRWASAVLLALVVAAPAAQAAPRDELSVLRTARGAEDRLPARFTTPSDVPRRSSRLARTTPRGVRLFVAAGSRTVCLFSIDEGGTTTTCNTLGGLRGGFVAGAFTNPFYGERAFVRGLVPDGVRRAIVKLEDGTTRTVTVRRNVWALETTARPTLVDWSRRGRLTRVRLVNGVPRPARD